MTNPNDTVEQLVERARTLEASGAWSDALSAYEAGFSLSIREREVAASCSILRWIGNVHYNRGDFELAEELYVVSLTIAELHGFRDQVAYGLNALGTVSQAHGRFGEAEARYERARTVADACGDDRVGAMVDQNLGILANIRGDVDTALERYRSALDRFRRLEDELSSAWALNNMGMAYVDRGAWSEAEAHFDEAFDLVDRLRDMGTLGNIELNRAELYLKRQHHGRARDSCDRAFEIFGRLESRSGLAESHKFYGVLHRETSKAHLAEMHFRQGVELARECGDRLLEAEIHAEWALVHLAESRNAEALAALNEAHHLFTELDAQREIVDLERRLDRLEARYLQVVKSWGESIESKDRYTAGHCQRVADYACMLAEAVGYRGRDLTWIRMGAFLHDVGKTAVPEQVLNKDGELAPEEWELMKSHTMVGDEIVAELGFPWEIRPLVRSHHERWDGGGYPDGLKAEAIPLTARILCVADVYDALTTERSYRPALSRDEAMRLMEREAGQLLDPDLFRIFRALIASESTDAASPGAAEPSGTEPPGERAT